MRAQTLEQAGIAGAWLDAERIPADRPVVFVLDDRGEFAWSRAWIAAHTIRAGLPSSRVESAYFYVGTPDDLLAGRPTTLQSAPPGGVDVSTYDSMSRTYFAGVRSVLPQAPVALALSSANPGFAAWVRSHPPSRIGPGVAVVQGPVAGTRIESRARPLGSMPQGQLVGLAALALAVVGIAGSGWTLTLFGRTLEALSSTALVPAVGTGMLVLGAIVLGRVGVRLNAAGTAATVVIVTAAGWFMPTIRRLAFRRSARDAEHGTVNG
jgi:hypothetical protein